MLGILSEHWVLVFVVAATSALLARIWWVRHIDSRFGIRHPGGRGGKLTVELPNAMAQVEFEVGATVDLIIYCSTLADPSGEPLPVEMHARVLTQLRSWATARRLTLAIPELHDQIQHTAA